nr:hypothetical protein B0A51_00126 [Rachicladosporium sp. CCFEE 5018]
MEMLTALARRLGLAAAVDAAVQVRQVNASKAASDTTKPGSRSTPIVPGAFPVPAASTLSPFEVRARLHDTLLSNHQRMLDGYGPLDAPVAILLNGQTLSLADAQIFTQAIAMSNAIKYQHAVFGVGTNTRKRRRLRESMLAESNPLMSDTYMAKLGGYLATNDVKTVDVEVLRFAESKAVPRPGVKPRVKRAKFQHIVDTPTRSQIIRPPPVVLTPKEQEAEVRYLYDALYFVIRRNHQRLLLGHHPHPVSEHLVCISLSIFPRIAALQRFRHDRDS